ncbi:hypothetical protein [Leptospira interrogans]|uniref:hypothetical protein n=1 Tax=Leptospira interrogans TaxID=173 RepID=UPI001F0FD8E5|nr:hypothetical protein [Leptospira interrogans]UMQ59866.1 hypothetical protein FH585_09125 [Leptospira interrogans]UNE66866.1 hypothetical protein FH588_20555 [Leptospira interrogans]UNE68789.1 hypothetical protein FH588_11485 [Leptospira interrogans]
MSKPSDWYEKRFFDLEKFNIMLLTPAPLDATAGLILEEEFLKIQKEDAKLVKYKVGLGGEVLVNENQNEVHSLELMYLPSAPVVAKLDLLKKAGTRFGILIQNKSAPKYKGVSSNCRILEKPNVEIGTKGFGNSVWKILMVDYTEVYLSL